MFYNRIRKAFILFISATVIFFFISCGGNSKNETRISLSGAFALYPLAQKWAEEYKKTHPGVLFDIQAGGAGKGMADALAGTVDVGMFSREITDVEKSKGIWWIALTKDAVFPTVNSQNPLIDSIRSHGLPKETFASVFLNQQPATWNNLYHTAGAEEKINVYTRSDAAGAADSWAAYFGKHQENLKGIGIFGDPSLADAIRKDKNGIGFTNTMYVYDQSSGKKNESIEVVPIDINGNGKIDDDENFYSSLSTVLAAVKSGKYPSPPARDLYFITKGKSQNKQVLDFFKWVLTTGQQYVATAGYVQLPNDVIQAQIKKLEEK